jgi:acetate---CoA ligase (ADP-forming)
MPPIDIRRLINPRSIALIGASAWTDAVAGGNKAIGYQGEIWRVHPSKPSSAQTPFYRSVAELPSVPDSAFVAVPNHEVAGVAAALAARGSGGFVCFSSGFSEVAGAEGARLTADLATAAGALPFFGPNCYGFVNYFDRVAMMPDQIVGSSPPRGVALICQSGTIALTLTYNRRSLPIGYVFSVGNQTRLAVEDLIEILSLDERVTAFGLYLEGLKDPVRFAHAAERARQAGKPIAIIKSGRTEMAARTAHTHTGAMTGADAVFDSYCRHLGLARCDTLATLCETLKVFHVKGPLPGKKVLIMGASGGDMAMTADVSRELGFDFSVMPPANHSALRSLLGERVTVANPLDIHTYLWFDPPALRRVFGEVLNAGYDAVSFMLDCPPEGEADTASFDAVIDVFIESARGASTRAALIASLPETLGEHVRQRCLAGGVAPLQGQREGLEAMALAAAVGQRWLADNSIALQIPTAQPAGAIRTLTEREGKQALAAFGVAIPRGDLAPADRAAELALSLGYPVVMKASGAHLAHKSEAGGVLLNIRTAADAASAAERLSALSSVLLVEEMLTDCVAEVLVGVVLDPQFGQVLVLGSGGIFTEILSDSASLLPPWNGDAIRCGLAQLAVAKLLNGFRGKPRGDTEALVDLVLGIARFASAHIEHLVELDVNPVIVRPNGLGAVAVDTLIRMREP